MTTPSKVKKQLLRYLNSVIWMQEFSVEDPLKQNPIIENVTYPPNAIVEIPIEGFDFSISSNNLIQTGEITPVFCTIKTAYKIVWVFDRLRYPRFHDIPIRQLEDLICKAGQMILVNSENIDQEIVGIEILRQISNNIGLKVKSANDVRSGTDQKPSWAIVCSLFFNISFISSLTDYTAENFKDIQPEKWQMIDDGEPIPEVEDWVLKGVNINIYRSGLPNVRPNEPDTYLLDEILEIRPPIND